MRRQFKENQQSNKKPEKCLFCSSWSTRFKNLPIILTLRSFQVFVYIFPSRAFNFNRDNPLEHHDRWPRWCVQNVPSNIGTGKLHVKNPSEKLGWLGGKSLRTFYGVVVFCCWFCFAFVFWLLFCWVFSCFKLLRGALGKSCSEDFYIQ